MIEIVVFADLVRAAGAVIVERALAGGRQAGEVDIIHLITAPGGIIDIVVKIIHIQIDLVIDIRLIGHIAGGRRGPYTVHINFDGSVKRVSVLVTSLKVDFNRAVEILFRHEKYAVEVFIVDIASLVDLFIIVLVIGIIIIKSALVGVRKISKANPVYCVAAVIIKVGILDYQFLVGIHSIPAAKASAGGRQCAG